MQIAALLFFVLIAQSGYAAEEPESYAGRHEMSGYRYSDFKDFEKEWHQVTVRYRKDTGEIRVTYANASAWEVLKNGGTKYPKGAAFAKLAVASQEDPLFPSSAVPSGVRRYQLMVYDPGKHAATDGWGYALFDAKGVTFPENPATMVQACHACHQLAKSRAYVFSIPMGLSSSKAEAMESLSFSDRAAETLPKELRRLLPEGTAKVRMLEGPMRKSLFQGTLDEIRPALAREAVRSRKPALLMSHDEKRFSVVFEIKKADCAGESGLKGIHNIFSGKQPNFEIEFCSSQL